MGQILHGSAKTTHAVRAAIQRSKASIKELAGRYGIQSIPTVVVFRDGKPVTVFVGAHAAATISAFLDDTIEKHGEAVDAA